MTLEELDRVVALAIGEAGPPPRISLERKDGVKMPHGFPRGELLCVNPRGTKVYSYDAHKVRAWLKRVGKGIL